MVTIYKNIYDKDNPYYISVQDALERIRSGNSKEKITEIRRQLDKTRSNTLKCNLPCVCFSGKFTQRTDGGLVQHSGYIVLDFDDVEDIPSSIENFKKHDYVYACWISPSGNGVKVLVKVSDGTKHREHFLALKDIFQNVDKSGINESRVCYESYDENIYINPNVIPFTKIVTHSVEKIDKKLESEVEVYENILKWLTNRGDAFQEGNRNLFVYKLASACCRFGISESEAFNYIRLSLNTDTSFSVEECKRTVRSAYRSNQSNFGTAEFTRDTLVDKTTRKELDVSIDSDIYNLEIRPKDVIFGEDVKGNALEIYSKGYENLQSTGIDMLDEYFKMKKTEISLLTGIGNYGKSTFLKYICLMKSIIYGDKWAIFTPEENPAEEFYHDLTEIYLGCDCTPYNHNKPSKERYEAAYDFISKHFFYVYPKDVAPSPKYIKERFLELIIKEKVTGCIIDPFNQLSNDYGSSGGRSDKYLESLLSEFLRFATINNQYFFIVAHPHKMAKDSTGNYPCPDVYDIADGAMWNNKMHNILVYHRPEHQINPQSTVCEFHSKKIKKQKIIGKKGSFQFEYLRGKRRFYFNGIDPMVDAITSSTSTGKTKSLYEEMVEYIKHQDDLIDEVF